MTTEFAMVDTIVADCNDWFEASSAIKDATKDNSLEAIQAALDYHFPVENGAETPFGPMWESGDSRYPLPIAGFPDSGLEILQASLTVVSSSLVRSRVADVLWVRKVKEAHKYARIAFSAYIDVANMVSEPLTVAYASNRAIELASRLNDSKLADQAIENAFSQLELLTNKDEWIPGASLRIAGSLSSVAKQYNIRDRLATSLNLCATRYAEDLHVLSGIRDLQVSIFRDTPSIASEFARLQVREWLAAAEQQTGLIRITTLRHARDIASASGLSAELAETRRLLEASPVKDEDLQQVSATVSLSTEEVRKFEDQFFFGKDMLSFLNLFGLHCPLPKERSKIEEITRKQMQEHPIQFLVSRVILNHEGLPVKFIQGHDDHFEHAIRSNQTLACQVWLSMAADIMRRALEEYPEYEPAVIEYFASEHFEPELRDVVLRAFKHFADSNFDESVCILLPRLEGALRQMARAVGMSVYSEPSGSNPGAYKTLGALLSQFEGILPDDYRRYFLTTIGDPLALNVRNHLCHGLMLSSSRNEAVLALHIATMLATLRVNTSSPSQAESSSP